MAIKQGVKLKLAAINPNAKYTLKYKYNISQVARNGTVTSKYSFSKLITPATNKYSYN